MPGQNMKLKLWLPGDTLLRAENNPYPSFLLWEARDYSDMTILLLSED